MNQLNRLTTISNGKALQNQINEKLNSFQTHSSDKEKTLQKEQDLDASDIFVQKGKLLLHHLLQKFEELHGTGAELGPDETSKVEDVQEYQEILFNIIIPKKEF